MESSGNKILLKSVVKENVSDIAQDILEMALDSALEEGILKEIPFISWLVKTGSIGRGIRDRLFLKKLGWFLHEAGRISDSERKDFAKRLKDDPEFAESTGESALMLIDNLSSSSKARLMGYTFRRFIQNDIDGYILNRVYAALEVMPYWMLRELPEYYFKRGLGAMGQGAAVSFQQLWLVEIHYGDKEERMHVDFINGGSQMYSYHQPFYSETPAGMEVAKLLRDYLQEPE